MGRPAEPAVAQPALLDVARAGDEQAYRAVVEPYHDDLHAHCTR